MRKHHLAATAVLAVSAAALVPTAAHADSSTPTTIYVGSSNKSCTNSGTGIEAAPFCTLQAGVDAASPGDTVLVASGIYAPVTIKQSGTVAEPIVIQGNFGAEIAGGAVAFTFTDVNYVSVKDFTMGYPEPAYAYITGSSHITVDRLWSQTNQGSSGNSLPGFEIAGSSSYVTVSRNEVDDRNRTAPSIQVDAGSVDDVITTNGIEYGRIAVNGASGTDITSNTIEGPFLDDGTTTAGIDLAGTSSNSTVENNVVIPDTYGSSPSSPTGVISVSSASTAGTTVDYNTIDLSQPDDGGLYEDYRWGANVYADPAAFTAATGQGAHDLYGNPNVGTLGGHFAVFEDSTDAPILNNADSAAPGELSTDVNADPRVTDPLYPQTGAGPYGYYDRGAGQLQPTFTNTMTAQANGALGVTAASQAWSSTWTFDFGDSTGPVAGSYGAASHTYAKPGTYTITVSGTSTLTGQPFTASATFTTTGSDYMPTGPTRILDTREGLGAAKARVPTNTSVPLRIAGNGSIPTNATAVALNVTVTDATGNGYISVIPSDGYATVSNLNYGTGQTVSNYVIVPVGPDGNIDLLNMGTAGGSADLVADISGYFTQAAVSGYTAVTPNRILDTRNGTGAPAAKIAPNHATSVEVAGADSIPAEVTAVALHVTVTDAGSNGWIAAEPDGAGTPSTSILNFGKGQTVSNTVIVPVAADGKIELYNGGGNGSVDLVGDVAGFFSTASTGAYTPVTPYRSWDSRNNGTALGADSTTMYSLDLSQYNSEPQLTIPADATLATNITVTGTTANGYLTAYPAGTARPGISNLNYGKGQTIGGLSLLATTGPTQQISVYNQSAGRGDVILDVFGYFSG